MQPLSSLPRLKLKSSALCPSPQALTALPQQRGPNPSTTVLRPPPRLPLLGSPGSLLFSSPNPPHAGPVPREGTRQQLLVPVTALAPDTAPTCAARPPPPRALASGFLLSPSAPSFTVEPPHLGAFLCYICGKT